MFSFHLFGGNVLESCITITQNFVSEHNLKHVLHFLKNKSSQISGIENGLDLHCRFREALLSHGIEMHELLKKRSWKEYAQDENDFSFEFH